MSAFISPRRHQHFYANRRHHHSQSLLLSRVLRPRHADKDILVGRYVTHTRRIHDSLRRIDSPHLQEDTNGNAFHGQIAGEGFFVMLCFILFLFSYLELTLSVVVVVVVVVVGVVVVVVLSSFHTFQDTTSISHETNNSSTSIRFDTFTSLSRSFAKLSGF